MPSKTRAAYALVTTGSGSPKSGAQVNLKLEVAPEEDGYNHAVGQHTAPHVGILLPTAGTTGSDGRLSFVFQAPVAGGTHTITATCVNCTNQATGTPCACEAGYEFDATRTSCVSTCPVSDLPPVTDPEILPFENNPDLSDTARLTDRMKTELSCLRTAAAAGSPKVGSAYRPPAYNQHLIDVWKKWSELTTGKYSTDPACADRKAKIQGHFQRHKLLESQPPVPGSLHTLGEAVDVTISLPPANIDALWPGCHLYRPPALRIKDPVHFIYR